MLLGVTIPVVGWAGRQFYTRAWTAFRHRSADMNTLIAVGTGAALLYSVTMTVADDWLAAHGVVPQVYYEAVVWIIALMLLGNLLEARAKGRTWAQCVGWRTSSRDCAGNSGRSGAGGSAGCAPGRRRRQSTARRDNTRRWHVLRW